MQKAIEAFCVQEVKRGMTALAETDFCSEAYAQGVNSLRELVFWLMPCESASYPDSPAPVEPTVEPVAEEVAEVEDATEEAEEEEQLTKEQVREIIQSCMAEAKAAGKKLDVTPIVAQFAPKLSEVSPKDYNALIEAVKAAV